MIRTDPRLAERRLNLQAVDLLVPLERSFSWLGERFIFEPQFVKREHGLLRLLLATRVGTEGYLCPQRFGLLPDLAEGQVGQLRDLGMAGFAMDVFISVIGRASTLIRGADLNIQPRNLGVTELNAVLALRTLQAAGDEVLGQFNFHLSLQKIVQVMFGEKDVMLLDDVIWAAAQTHRATRSIAGG